MAKRRATVTQTAREGGDPKTLLHRAERIQDRMRVTVRAIRQKLSPGRNLKPVLNDVGQALAKGSRAAVRTMKENPIPWILVGVGTVGTCWLLFGSRKKGSGGGSRGRKRPGRLVKAAREVGKKTGDVTDNLGRRAAAAGRGIVRAAEQVRETLRRNPLALAGTGMAVGTALGLSLPRTVRTAHAAPRARSSRRRARKA